MKTGRERTLPWVFEALKALGGTGKVIQVADYIWDNYSSEILRDKKMLLTWQYEMRWAVNKLRDQGVMERNTSKEPSALTSLGKGMTKL